MKNTNYKILQKHYKISMTLFNIFQMLKTLSSSLHLTTHDFMFTPQQAMRLLDALA